MQMSKVNRKGMLVENLLGMWTMELLPLVHADPRVLSDVLTGKYNQLKEWMNNNKLVINPARHTSWS